MSACDVDLAFPGASGLPRFFRLAVRSMAGRAGLMVIDADRDRPIAFREIPDIEAIRVIACALISASPWSDFAAFCRRHALAGAEIDESDAPAGHAMPAVRPAAPDPAPGLDIRPLALRRLVAEISSGCVLDAIDRPAAIRNLLDPVRRLPGGRVAPALPLRPPEDWEPMGRGDGVDPGRERAWRQRIESEPGFARRLFEAEIAAWTDGERELFELGPAARFRLERVRDLAVLDLAGGVPLVAETPEALLERLEALDDEALGYAWATLRVLERELSPAALAAEMSIAAWKERLDWEGGGRRR